MDIRDYHKQVFGGRDNRVEEVKKIDEVIIKVWDMSSASQEPDVRRNTLEWAREELLKISQLFPQPLEDRPRIICLCGSTRFIEVFQEYYAKLTDEGYIVLTVGRIVPKHEQESERKRKLDELHLRKIDLADEVMILNVGGYIGNSTRAEIEYAIKIGKPVKYLEGLI